VDATQTAKPERYTRSTTAQGLRLITRLDGRPLGTPPPAPDPQLQEARDLIRRAAQALRRPVSVWRPPPLRAPASRPPELARIDGAALCRARAVARISQRDLAAELDYSRSVVAEAERGRRSVPERLAWWAYRVLHAAGQPVPPDGGVR